MGDLNWQIISQMKFDVFWSWSWTLMFTSLRHSACCTSAAWRNIFVYTYMYIYICIYKYVCVQFWIQQFINCTPVVFSKYIVNRCVYIYIYIYLFIYSFIYLSICLFIYLFMYLFIFFCVHTYDEGVCERIEIEKQRKRERERETFIGNKCEERNILGLVSNRERPKVMPFRHDFTGFFRLRQNMQNRKKWPQEVAIE